MPGEWIQTVSVRRFHVMDPVPAEVYIEDIAHALSLLCRFNGHCLRFYSVAEHCVRVSRVLDDDRDAALWGLLHDAAEAYVGDVPRPVKRLLARFDEVEDRILRVVLTKYGLGWPAPAAVWRADDQLLVTEARDLMHEPPEPWGLAATPLPAAIEPWPPEEARHAFLARFAELRGG